MGAEGFIMGTLYTTVGLCAAGLLWLAPKASDAKSQRVLCYGLMAIGAIAYKAVVGTHAWKNGFSASWYLPFVPF
jgi:hypothetical protein